MPRRRRSKYEAEFGVRDLEGGGLTGFRQFGLRAYRLENQAQVGMSIAEFPQGAIPNIASSMCRAAAKQLGADPDLVLQEGRRRRARRRDRDT